jgi:hypothetical protein
MIQGNRSGVIGIDQNGVLDNSPVGRAAARR